MIGEDATKMVAEVIGAGVPYFVSDKAWQDRDGWWRVAILMRRPSGNRAAMQPRFRRCDDATVFRLAVRRLIGETS